MPKYKHGSGSLYKRRKTWWIAYYDHGKQVCESAKTKNKAEARSKLNERLGEIAKGEFIGPTAERVTFEELAEMIQTDYKVNGKRSAKGVERRIRLHLAPFFGGKKAHAITSTDVQSFIAKRLEQKARNAGINRELAVLKRVFNLALQFERITRSPRIPRLEEHNVRQGFFGRADFEAILARLPDYLRPPATFAYTIGWRLAGEVLSLTWQQVDLAEGTV